MFKTIGLTEVIIIALVVIILFGGRKLPELGRNIGEAIRELKTSFKGGDKDK